MAPLLLAVFDLDYTIWDPEMYQIHGPPSLVKEACSTVHNSSKRENCRSKSSLWTKTTNEGMIVADKSGTPISIFDGAAHALSEINRMKKLGTTIQAAVASRTDEPDWARICMKYLVVHDGATLQSCFDHVEISFSDKKAHFKNLKHKTGIPYESMVFFDNEYWNISSVSSLGVRCFHTPDGMRRKDWEDALKDFD
mmetsp:Transcript_26195/g.37558  ORF Transcript_26195/g.37558 Transcript_26195/m.37558 type:complete len:196 (+) Transcript_26195:63-650(+)